MRGRRRDLRAIVTAVDDCWRRPSARSAQAVEELPDALLVEAAAGAIEERLGARRRFGPATEAAQGVDRQELALHRELAGGELRGVLLGALERGARARGEGRAGALEQRRFLRERVGGAGRRGRGRGRIVG